jgi:hypothetical protein
LTYFQIFFDKSELSSQVPQLLTLLSKRFTADS